MPRGSGCTASAHDLLFDTVDAGEAGVRASGNVNIAALTNASAASAQAAQAAQDVVQRQQQATRQALPSIFTVQVLGFGDAEAPKPPAGPRSGLQPSSYNPNGVVQVLEAGRLTEEEMRPLTATQRRNLAQ